MNALDVLKYGHQTVLRTIDRLPKTEWDTPGVCGRWSSREIIAHLASFEHVLVDVLNSLLNDNATPTLDKYRQGPLRFNDDEVDRRQHMTVDEVMADYCDTYAQAARLLARIPLEERRRAGALPWYGDEYDLEDYIAYAFYGHKREHSAQIAVFCDRFSR
jgi:hypothetical protein